ncbi:HNH endonuclease, partial [Arthrospira platensis SPKY1]|nr:HNH endonuclease [Arthrospira platensis SPKY1]
AALAAFAVTKLGRYVFREIDDAASWAGQFFKKNTKNLEDFKAVQMSPEDASQVIGYGPIIRNKKLAGSVHPKTNVPFDEDGFPDFSDFLYKGTDGNPDVTITYSGHRALDEKIANMAAGFDETPEGYTWHHHQDHGRMQLVDSEIHRKTGHTGGFSLHDVE